MSEPRDCDECEGTGVVECQCCGSPIDCDECEGTGAIEEEE